MRSTLIVVVAVFLLCSIAFGEIPQVISYQGKVTDSGSTPVADGTYTMRFRIYDASSSGNLEWDSGDRTIAVSGGVFNVLLGENPQPAITLDFGEDYWLLVRFEGNNQTPRQKLGSVGYAYMASGLVAGTEVSGSVTIGTLAAIKGVNTATIGTTYGVWGESASESGRGVYGYASNALGGRGVYGRSAGYFGRGVWGEATDTMGETRGVYGVAHSTLGTGVLGEVSASTGTTYGVYGFSNSMLGTGVYGYAGAATGTTYGGKFESFSTDGRGVYGEAFRTSGDNMGGHFKSNSSSGRGVYGYASATTGTTYGVYGQAASSQGYGVYGNHSATTGTEPGVLGVTVSVENSAAGVVGIVESTTPGSWSAGVRGINNGTGTTGVGVYGSQDGNGWGVYGTSSAGYGVYGRTTAGSGAGVGVYGQTSSTTSVGIYYSGGLAGTGSKSCVVKTSQGPALLYCQESPENWFEDFGEATLQNGRASVMLDPVFLETVTVDENNPMHVFIQPKGNCNGTYVECSRTGFDVVELNNGNSGILFSYRVVAKRKGFEEKRLDICEAGRTDPYLYPELLETETKEHEEERARMETGRRRMEEERTRMEAGRARMEPERARVTEVGTRP